MRRGSSMLFLAFLFLLIHCRKNNQKAPETTVYTNIVYTIAPQATDPLIMKALDNHVVYLTTNPVKKNLLYVFLPGTGRNPAGCQATVIKAANLGFHSIGLMYDNSFPGNPLCEGGTDVTCHSRARREVIDGIDRHPSVATDTAESVINRLYELLRYLNIKYPTQNWSQFIEDGQPNWSKIIIAGHSQGGCLAGVIGKYYPVKKVIMYAAIDFMLNKSIPDWEQLQTNKEKYFALINVKDEQLPYSFVQSVWAALEMTQYGNTVDVSTNPPYGHSHTLITTASLSDTLGSNKYHNSMGVDSNIPKDGAGSYIYDAAWQYLMTEGN